MRNVAVRHGLFVALLFWGLSGFSQQIVQVKIVDKITKSPLVGAQVYFYGNKQNALTTENGTANISLARLPDSAVVSYLGYNDLGISVKQNQSNITIALEPIFFQAERVIVSTQKVDENVSTTQEAIRLTKEDMYLNPSFMGESDVIRTVAASVGVTQFEGMQGMYVRGGSQEQNLVLFDNAIIYNPSHILGIFSVFNPDIVSSVSLYKSGIPAQYGGRLSSVLSVTSQDAIVPKWNATISTGLLASRLTTAIPLSQRSTLRLSYRKSYVNFVILPIVTSLIKTESVQPSFDFSDITARYDFKRNDKESFSVSAYSGNDNFLMLSTKDAKFRNQAEWGNRAVSVQWKRVLKHNFVQKVSMAYSNYEFVFDVIQSYYNLQLKTGIQGADIKYALSKKEGKHSLNFGVENLLQFYNTGQFKIYMNDELFQKLNSILSKSNELALFFEDSYDCTDRLSFIMGLRGGLYAQSFADSLSCYYTGFFEPRAQMRYRIRESSSFKASLAGTTQNLHMVSMLSAALPADIWFPANKQLQPIKGLLMSLGYYKNFAENTYETSVSLYYKHMRNITEFKEGFINLYTNDFYEKLTSGTAFASGIEFEGKKQKGKVTGEVSYSFSRCLRKFPEINENYRYPASYDRPHNFSAGVQYKINEKLALSAYWTYMSGKVYSEPKFRYVVNGNLISEYNAVNNQRMPAYHRLDVSAEYLCLVKPTFDLKLIASVYNAYNRMNAYYMAYDMKGDMERFSIQMNKEIVGLFPILPSLSLLMHIK